MFAPDWILKNANSISGEIVNAPARDRGPLIRKYRRRTNLTQGDLSLVVHLRRETISRIEHGKVTPTLAFIRTLSGISALMEAVKTCRSRNEAIEPAYFVRIGDELGVPREYAARYIDVAIHNYEKKRKKIIRNLEK